MPTDRPSVEDRGGACRTPAALGYQMPPEWAPHAATWLSWPHNLDTWPEGRIRTVERVLAEAIRLLQTGEAVHINVLNGAHEAHVRALVGEAERGYPVRYHHIPTDDAWCRDHGATFVVRDGEAPLAAVDWTYNAWGGKYPPYDRDAAVARRMAEALDVPCFATGLVAEGGAIEVNGEGLLLTTASCLLNPNRNPNRTRSDVERVLREMLGIQQVVWLEGDLAGDDTDGHIDNLVRFVGSDTVVVAVENDPNDANYAPLQTNLARLRELRTVEGRALRVIPLPMPGSVWIDGARLPASYANFYIANRVVLVPLFGDPRDASALQGLQECFPGRRVVGLEATDVLWGLGAFHCLTQQIPCS